MKFIYGTLRRFTLEDDEVKLEYTEIKSECFEKEDLLKPYNYIPKEDLREIIIPIQDIKWIAMHLITISNPSVLAIKCRDDVSLAISPQLEMGLLDNLLSSPLVECLILSINGMY